MTDRYDAVVFDLDGTLIDTENLCNAAGVTACRRLGHDVGLGFFETLAGIDDDERVRLISALIIYYKGIFLNIKSERDVNTIYLTNPIFPLTCLFSSINSCSASCNK